LRLAAAFPLLVMSIAAAPLLADPAVRPVEGAVPPHYVSLASNKVFMREGPTYNHRIIWVYHRRGLPLLETAEYDVWRRVQDSDGTVGWVHSSMISNDRTVLITSRQPAEIRAHDGSNSPILALAQPGVIAKLQACDPAACLVSAGSTEGWIEKKNIWGVKPGDVFH
jgi:SH3-like domain-containing protein